MITRVPVPLGERTYDILIGAGLLRNLAAHLESLRLGKRAAVITDERVAPLYGSAVRHTLANAGYETTLLAIPAGENSKNLAEVEKLYNGLLDGRLDRSSFVLALGGGVVGDVAGFVAATYLRGIAYVQVPTTLLAQVDSSVGGKVGVNLPRGKNLVGAFHQPCRVIVDTATLTTLPEREYRAGLAEVIKYGVIWDAALFDQLEAEAERVLDRDLVLLERIIARCCAIKAEVVSKDEREEGLRAILNFGHTIGHALEAASRYGEYLHGEAVAIGMARAARLSLRRGHLKAEQAQRLERLLRRYGFDLEPKPLEFQQLLTALRLDKKAREGALRFVLARDIGSVFVTAEVTEDDLQAVWR